MEPIDDYLINDLAPDDDYDLDLDSDELTYDYDMEDLGAEDSGVIEFINLEEPDFSVASLRPIPAKEPKRFVTVFTVLATIGIVASVWSLGKPFLEEYRSEQKFEKLKQESLVAFTEDDIMEDIPMSMENTPKSIENPYENIFSQNEDMVAWLVVEDTVIDYPVMQTMRNEEYYLHRDFYGKPDKSGCLLLDTDSTLYDSAATSNLIIHGHNMKLGTMFGSLDQYNELDYWQEHQYIDLYTKNELREYQVIAVFYSQVYYPEDQVFKYYNFFHADTEESFADFYNNIKTLSLYDTGVEAQLGDQFLTLSTCAYHVEEGRFVVVCKECARSQQYQFSQ